MQLPAPDTGLSSFPVSDSATVSMPGPDSGAITFPPAPIPIVVITAVTVVDVETSVETLTVPWYVVETVVDVATGVEVLASVTVEAETTVDVETTVIQIFDSVTAETNRPLSVPVLANDGDPNGDPLTVLVDVPPADGTAGDCLTDGEEGKFAEGTTAAEILANPEDYYVNVHNEAFPNGAIRGQLVTR